MGVGVQYPRNGYLFTALEVMDWLTEKKVSNPL